MTKHMLIDATHDEETRVVVMNGRRIEEYDIETSSRRQLKGNIYLAKVIRIEPSLQAAFVDYGGNRHGFLAFSEIHPDYFQIPVADREQLLALQEEEYAAEAHDEGESEERPRHHSDRNRHHDDDERPETVSGENDTGEENTAARRTARFLRNYRIQEVIRRRQILLVQVTKEERGTKGAALSTYISLPGRYCVLMPNALRGGGVSRKITSDSDRRRLRDIISGLNLPSSMAMIVRTAGGGRPGQEVVRDCDYLLQLWDDIRSRALTAIAPALVYEEASIIKRAIRDLYTRDIEDIIVDSEEAWKNAREFTRQLMPHNTNKVKLWQNRGQSLFSRYNVEDHLEAMVSPTVQLESGGYIVINQTEALVAIDVNSGKSTSQRNIEETALRTNLEAADEVARQLRLRDLAGLIVIDFIDMESRKHNAQVEKRLKDALRHDRARIQVGKISHFGLLEMSRQRLRPSLAETMLSPCPQCHGTGSVRGTESTVLHVLRAIEEEGAANHPAAITVHVAPEIALYILNSKRDSLSEIEERFEMKVAFEADKSLTGTDIKIVPDEEAVRISHTSSHGHRPSGRPMETGRQVENGERRPQPRIIDIEEVDAPFIEKEIVIPDRRAARNSRGAERVQETRPARPAETRYSDSRPQESRHPESRHVEAQPPEAPRADTQPESRGEENEGTSRRKRRRNRKDRGNGNMSTGRNNEQPSHEAAAQEPPARGERGGERGRARRAGSVDKQAQTHAPKDSTSDEGELLMPGRRRTRLRRRADEAHPAPRHAPAPHVEKVVSGYQGPTPADPFGHDIFDMLDTAAAPAPAAETAPTRPARKTRRTGDKAAKPASVHVEHEAPVAPAPSARPVAHHAPEVSPEEEAPRKRRRTRKSAATEAAPQVDAPQATPPAAPKAPAAAQGENLAAPKPVNVDEVTPAKRRVGWWKR